MVPRKSGYYFGKCLNCGPSEYKLWGTSKFIRSNDWRSPVKIADDGETRFMNKVSIIVPVYNVGPYLRNSIGSLLELKDCEFEIILVDDGSQDDSAEICREFQRANPGRVRFIQADHGGVSAARNIGLDAAEGDWIYFSDSDDYVENDLVSHLLTRAVEHDAGMSCGAIICEGTDEIRTNFRLSEETEVWDREKVLNRALRPFFRLHGDDSGAARGYLLAVLLKRSLIESHHIRFTPGQRVMEDESFLLRCLLYVDKLALSKKVLYHYVSRSDSACARFFRQKTYSLHERELQWAMVASNRVAVYDDGGLADVFPGISGELRVGRAYHESLAICSGGEGGFARRLDALAVVRRRTLDELRKCGACSAALPLKQRPFYSILRLGALPVCVFCTMICAVSTMKGK